MANYRQAPILEFDNAWHVNTIHLYGHIHDNSKYYNDIYEKLGFKAEHGLAEMVESAYNFVKKQK